MEFQTVHINQTWNCDLSAQWPEIIFQPQARQENQEKAYQLPRKQPGHQAEEWYLQQFLHQLNCIPCIFYNRLTEWLLSMHLVY